MILTYTLYIFLAFNLSINDSLNSVATLSQCNSVVEVQQNTEAAILLQIFEFVSNRGKQFIKSNNRPVAAIKSGEFARLDLPRPVDIPARHAKIKPRLHCAVHSPLEVATHCDTT